VVFSVNIPWTEWPNILRRTLHKKNPENNLICYVALQLLLRFRRKEISKFCIFNSYVITKIIWLFSVLKLNDTLLYLALLFETATAVRFSATHCIPWAHWKALIVQILDNAFLIHHLGA